jgi:hypothetical protein
MMTTFAARLAWWTTLVVLMVGTVGAEQPDKGAKRGQTAEKSEARKRHRLPAHYAAIVNEKQREAIYQIQDEYQPRIDRLQKQLDALKGELDGKISALLTAEQKKQFEDAKARAKANRKAKKRHSNTTAGETPASSAPTRGK